MHAQESAQNLAKSNAMQGLSGDQVRRQAVADTTKVADHGTPTLHAQDAVKNVTASKAQPASIAGSKSPFVTSAPSPSKPNVPGASLDACPGSFRTPCWTSSPS